MALPEVEPYAEKQSPGRILVVDDDPAVRRMLARLLRRNDHTTTEAGSAREAVEIARQEAFDVVVSDVQMPDIDGLGLLHALHELDPDVPVLLLSGAPDLDTALKAIEYSAFEYLSKPVDLDKLLSSVTRAIDVVRRRREDHHALEQFRSGERLRAPRAMSTTDVQTGALLGGRYRVGKLLGEGGMGAVYEAVREDLGQMRVALKVLHGNICRDAQHLARFRREAETVAAINHPNIVRILDFQATNSEPAFLVMELLDGVSLGQAIEIDGPFSQRRAAFVASQVLAALAAAHRGRVVHRDLKPDNVFLTSVSGVNDIVKLLDFGIAKVETAADQKLTRTGAILGTPAYMAPELARGASIDTRSDIYAVGCVLYEVLTGAAPFQAENYNALLFAIQQSEPIPLSDLRQDLDPAFVRVVTTAMAKDPAARFQHAESMIRALGPWSSSRESLPPPSPSPLAFAPTLPPTSDVLEGFRLEIKGAR
jgi:CheY-like chemotaxis protein